MARLETIINFDSRGPWEKITRWEAYKIADAHKIPYPPNAPLNQMVGILQHQGIDPTSPLPDGSVEWETIYGVDEKGRQTINRVPKRTQNISASRGIDYEAKLEALAAKNHETDVDAKIAAAVNPLSDKVDKLIEMLSAKKPGRPKKDPE